MRVGSPGGGPGWTKFKLGEALSRRPLLPLVPPPPTLGAAPPCSLVPSLPASFAISSWSPTPIVWPANGKEKKGEEEERKREKKRKEVGVFFMWGLNEIQRDFMDKFAIPIGFNRYFICDSYSLAVLLML